MRTIMSSHGPHVGIALLLFLAIAWFGHAQPVLDAVSWEKRGNEHVTLVDVTFTISGTTNDCYVALWGHDEVTREHFPMNQFLQGDIKDRRFAPGTHTVSWLASLDGAGRTSDNFQVFARVSDQGRVAAGRYLVIDVSGGPSAESYPVFYLDNVIAKPENALNATEAHFDVTRDKYKKDYIVLRELPDGSYAGIYQVTQRQYEHVTGQTPSHFGGNPMRPVESVSWNAITGSGAYGSGFIALLRQKTGLSGLNLPSSAAWEYACRAGATNDYNDYTQNNGLGASDEATLGNLGWYSSNSGSRTHDVGGKQPNAWGLYDMHGSVWDWTTTVSGSHRVYRGGAWIASAGFSRAGYVSSFNPGYGNSNFGFRLALPAVQKGEEQPAG